jgi:putative Mg2+ transporter-C (MgtC) family protein
MGAMGAMDAVPVRLQAELLLRFGLAALLGGLLGWDRQLGQHPAGLRVHVLVALGAAVFTVAGVYGVAGLGTVQDAGRVAAQVVVGVGFLGAGTIWRSRDDRVIYGLTTAASIWLAAGLGMLAAYGLYVLAGGGALLGVAALRAMKPLERAALALPWPSLPALPRLSRGSARVGPAAPATGAAPVADAVPASEGVDDPEAVGAGAAGRDDPRGRRAAAAGGTMREAVPPGQKKRRGGKQKRRLAPTDEAPNLVLVPEPRTA